MKYVQFIERVAERTPGASLGQAEVLTEATLRTLAERITAGEARDLAAHLPKELQEPLTVDVSGPAEAFGLDEFVRRVAERAGVSETMAREGVRAVLLTLRGAVSHGEFDDVMAQLPDEFRQLLKPVATTR